MEVDKSQIKMNPEKEGFLTKQGGWMKTWRLRWFVLKGSVLYYYHNKSDPEPKGEINLTGVYLIFGSNRSIYISPALVKAMEIKETKKIGKKNVFEIASCFLFLDSRDAYPETTQEMDDWIVALTKATSPSWGKKTENAQNERFTWYVRGMMCERCVEKARLAVSKLSGVVGSEINLEEETIVVIGKFNPDEVSRQLEDYGYLTEPCGNYV